MRFEFATAARIVFGSGTVRDAPAAAAEMGRRTLLVEVEERQGIAELFGIAALPYEERRIASVAPGALGAIGAREPRGARGAKPEGEVFALAIDIEHQ